jgi:Uma2 family endonuclease
MALGVDNLPPAYLLTWQDWLRLEARDDRRYELLGGELYVSPSPSVQHQRLVRDLLIEIHSYLSATSAGEVLPAPLGVRLSGRDVVEPDLFVLAADSVPATATSQASQILPISASERPFVDGVPTLVVEILSPGTARRDLGVKRALYERSGVGEYWIVDPLGERIDVYALVEGIFCWRGTFERADELRSATFPDLVIPLARVFSRF